MNAFNEFGKPIDSVEEVASSLERQARQFLESMVEQGYSATEIRAIGSYLSGSVDLAATWAVLHAGDKIRRDRIKNADPNLDDEERGYAALGEKIQAIKHYRERTGHGLREAKDAVEKYIRENL